MASRRERILEAAREIIAERGFEGLTMRDLAVASHVTVPTVYNLIGGKDAVLFAAVEEQTERFVQAFEASRGESPVSEAIAVVEATVRELLSLPRYYRALLLLLFTSAAAATARRGVNQAMRAQFRHAIDGLDEAGLLSSWVEPEILAERMTGQLNMVALQWAAGGVGPDAFRAGSVLDASTTLLGVTREPAREELRGIAERAQRRALPRRGSRKRAAGTGKTSEVGS